MRIPGKYCLSYILAALMATLWISPGYSMDAETQEALKAYEKRINKLEKKLKRYRNKTKKLDNKFDEAESRLLIDGFLSAGFAKTDEDGFSYFYGTGLVGSEPSFVADSVMAIQFEFLASEDISVYAQLWGFGREGFDNTEDNWDVRFEWANIAWRIRDNFTLRAGRLRLPFFAVSEYVDVGFSYPWARPPGEVYDITITSYEGFDFIYNVEIADWSVSTQGFTGKGFVTRSILPFSGEDAFGLSIRATRGPWSARVGYTMAKLALGTKGEFAQLLILTEELLQGQVLMDGAAAAGIPFIAPLVGPIAIDASNGSMEFMGIALSYDTGKFFALSERTIINYKDAAWPNRVSHYLTLGYRYHRFTPFIHFAQIRVTNNDAREPIRNLALDFQSVGNTLMYTTLIDIFDGIQKVFDYNQKTYAMGLRYELSSKVSLKLQSEKSGEFKGGLGMFTYTGSESGSPKPHSIHLHSFVIDAIF